MPPPARTPSPFTRSTRPPLPRTSWQVRPWLHQLEDRSVPSFSLGPAVVPADVTTDAAGNVYVVGTFTGTADFDPGAGVAARTSAGRTDAFVASYTPAGAFRWAERAGSPLDDAAVAVAVGGNGAVAVTGSFQGTAGFGPTPLTSSGNKDAFVWSLAAATGGTNWAVRPAGVNSEVPTAVAVGPNGEVYAGGNMFSAVSFGPTTLAYRGGGDGWVWALDAAGGHRWATRVGGAEANAVNDLGVDAAGNLYVVGSFVSSLQLATTAGLVTRPAAGGRDAFVWKVAPAGNGLWLTAGGGTGDDAAVTVAPTASGVVVGGTFRESATFGTATVAGAGGADALLWQLGGDGATAWAVRGGGERRRSRRSGGGGAGRHRVPGRQYERGSGIRRHHRAGGRRHGRVLLGRRADRPDPLGAAGRHDE